MEPLTLGRRALLVGAAAAVPTTLLLPSASAAPNRHPSKYPSLYGETVGPEDVRALQYLLMHAGFEQPVMYRTYARPIYESVKAFQRKHGLAATGRCTPGTLGKLCVRVERGSRNRAVTAIHTLLDKHGYGLHPSTVYGYQTNRDVRGIQAGHGLKQREVVTDSTWKVLFGDVTSGPMFPMMQAGTGAAEWANCGPTSLCMVLLNRGKKPAKWNWKTKERSAAVRALRYGAMGVANTASRNQRGTEYPDLKKGLSHYGLSSWHGGISDTLRYARQGKSSLAGGNAYALPWNRGGASYVHGPVSHWIAVLGYNGTHYLVADPIAYRTHDCVHLVSEKVLRTYASTNPGWYPGHPTMAPPSKNSVLVR